MSKPIECRDNLKYVVLASVLKIPPNLLLDCRCACYGVYGGEYLMTSWAYEWEYELSKYTPILKQSPYFINQKKDAISTDTLFKRVDN